MKIIVDAFGGDHAPLEILKGAMQAVDAYDVDIILTGDKDFLSLDMEHPKCMTVAQFLESEGVED